MKITVLGCRGSIPVCGEKFLKYGGNTSCYAIEAGKDLIAVDAGSGLPDIAKLFADCKSLSLLLTHLHLDHIIGLMMCPLFFQGDFTLHIYTPSAEGKMQLENVFSHPYWPIRPSELPCHVFYHVMESDFSIGSAKIHAMNGDHPGGCQLISVEADGKKAVFASDNTISPELETSFSDFCHRADLLLLDGMYLEKDWTGKESFGHTTLEKAAAFGSSRKIRTLITHHDPSRTDRELDEISLPPTCSFAYQGEEIIL